MQVQEAVYLLANKVQPDAGCLDSRTDGTIGIDSARDQEEEREREDTYRERCVSNTG